VEDGAAEGTGGSVRAGKAEGGRLMSDIDRSKKSSGIFGNVQ
jgi:hypothetical protein